MKAARFTADEIERVNYLTTKGYLPVAVDVASRVFQVCYCIQRKKDLTFHKNGIMHLLDGSCRFNQKDQICDAV